MIRRSRKLAQPLAVVVAASCVFAASATGCGDSDEPGKTGPGKGGSAGSGGKAGGGSGGLSAGEGGVEHAGGAANAGSGGTVAGTTHGGAAGQNAGGEGGGDDPCASCRDQNRECDADVGVCGECLPDFSEEAGECVCPEGEVPENGECVACADDFVPSCTVAGETGSILRKSDGVCICETEAGYFFSLESNSAQPCDRDGDGWVNDGAQPALDGSDDALRENARCALRRVQAIELENDAGDTKAFDLTDDFPDGLPLYESPRDDGAPSAMQHANYGTRALKPEVLNSFTKACVTGNGDYNDNGISDISEWSGGTLGERPTRNSRIQGYYRRYLRFSYYLELHDGWFEREDGVSRYRIRERTRKAQAGNVPVQYPPGTNAYWRQCDRHLDIDYSGSPTSYAGADFVEATGSWHGMLHHSQFKCVEVLSQSDYGTTHDRERNPEVVFTPGQTGLARRASQGTVHGCPDAPAPGVEVYDWSPNQCGAAPTTRSAPSSLVVNTKFADVACSPISSNGIEPGVYWVAVGYENYACDRSDAVTVGPDDYTRGCANQCAEQGVSACPDHDENSPTGSNRFTCDDESRVGFGALHCGCGLSYAGPSCEIGCASDHLLYPDGFSIETRSGYWMCGGPNASLPATLKSTEFTLVGTVPFSPGGAEILESSNGRYRMWADE